MPDIIYSITLVAGAVVIILQEKRIKKIETHNENLKILVRMFIKEVLKGDTDGKVN